MADMIFLDTGIFKVKDISAIYYHELPNGTYEVRLERTLDYSNNSFFNLVILENEVACLDYLALIYGELNSG